MWKHENNMNSFVIPKSMFKRSSMRFPRIPGKLKILDLTLFKGTGVRDTIPKWLREISKKWQNTQKISVTLSGFWNSGVPVAISNPHLE